MDEFVARLAEIDRKQMKQYLVSLQDPCYESQLLKLAFPELEIFRADALTLYQNHFLLFHLLYQLQQELYEENHYLFIHFMRTVVRPYPPQGQCRFFNTHLLRFCRAPCPFGKSYCHFHAAHIGDASLEELSAKYFYLDSRNYYRLDAAMAEAFMDGAWELLTHYTAYQQSFRVLGLPESADIPLIKKTFKRLAKQYHPDLGAQHVERFHEINNAYQLLLRLHSLMKS